MFSSISSNATYSTSTISSPSNSSRSICSSVTIDVSRTPISMDGDDRNGDDVQHQPNRYNMNCCSPRNDAKHVRFSSNHLIRIIPRRDQYTAKQQLRLWYTIEDYELITEDCRLAVLDKMLDDDIKEEKQTKPYNGYFRGLESKTPEGEINKKVAVLDGLCSVLLEQEKQRQKGIVDVEEIREAYMSFTVDAALEAAKLGQQDAIECCNNEEMSSDPFVIRDENDESKEWIYNPSKQFSTTNIIEISECFSDTTTSHMTSSNTVFSSNNEDGGGTTRKKKRRSIVRRLLKGSLFQDQRRHHRTERMQNKYSTTELRN